MAGSCIMAMESMKHAARRPSPPLPRPASGSCSSRASGSRFLALRCFGWVVAHASVVMRWHGTSELGGPTGAIVLSPDVAGGVLPVDLWTTRLRCPQIHRHRDHNSKAIFHLVAPDPIAPYPPQIARSRKWYCASREAPETAA